MGRKFLLVSITAGLVAIVSFVFRWFDRISDGTLIALIGLAVGLVAGYVGANILQKNIESKEKIEIGTDKDLP